MNREEFANKWAAVEIYEDGLPISIVIQARYNDLLADLDSLTLPPAEGAETILKEGLDDGRYADIVDGINIDVKQPFYQAIIRYAEDVVAAQPQPKLDPKKVQWSGYGELGNISQKPLQPTAEGAGKTCHAKEMEYNHNMCAMQESCEKCEAYKVPTAEGAEEMDARTYLDEWMRQHNYRSNKLIGWSEAVDFAEEFATLHAQRIAEKMVEERMEQYKAQFKDRPNPLEINPYDSKGIKRIRNRKIH